jgi:hypothetical protein
VIAGEIKRGTLGRQLCDSEQTIAQGIVNSAEERKIGTPRAEGFKAIPGHGHKRR